MPLATRKKPVEAEVEKKEAAVENTEKEVVATSVSAKVPVEEIKEDVFESKCDKIAFVAALGDPSRDDVTPADVEKGIARRVDPTIVGFAFKILEDMEVPDCGIPADLKENNMAYVDKEGKKMVKAGETVYLTRFETGMLLAPQEFNGKATGGQMPVGCTFTVKKKTTKAGAVSTVSGANTVPVVSLRPLKTGMSIKDIEMINVLTFTSEKKENGQTRKTRKIVPGFEKWESLCKVSASSAGTRTRSAASNRSERSKGAQVFLSIVNARK